MQRFLPAAGLSLVLFACNRAEKAPAQPAPQPPVPVEEAQRLIKGLSETLLGELQTAMGEKGPAAAIGICADRAPEVAKSLATGAYQVRRIGTRVRNKERNTPTAAELEVLATLSPEKPTFQGEIDGKPVFMKALYIPGALCLTCHGAPDAIPADVQAALAERYPEDAATGYAVGDLRGALIVEPKP
ncbi:MAG: DUF3365 domain-containing protein [Planctomycetota bacterium]